MTTDREAMRASARRLGIPLREKLTPPELTDELCARCHAAGQAAPVRGRRWEITRAMLAHLLAELGRAP